MVYVLIGNNSDKKKKRNGKVVIGSVLSRDRASESIKLFLINRNRKYYVWEIWSEQWRFLYNATLHGFATMSYLSHHATPFWLFCFPQSVCLKRKTERIWEHTRKDAQILTRKLHKQPIFLFLYLDY